VHLGRARWYSPRVLGRKARDPRGSIGQDWNCWSNRSLLANSSAGCLRHNLAELARWVDNREGRHDWDLYAAYALTCEGIPQPTAAQVADRLALTRAKMTRLMPADAGREQPLGESAPPRYAHVYSGFCADSATGDKQTWRRFMRNIASLVAEGGTFWTAALHRATSYRAGRHRFPSANLDSADLQEILALDFLPQSIAVEVRALPQMREHGYAGIILARARKQRRCGS